MIEKDRERLVYVADVGRGGGRVELQPLAGISNYRVRALARALGISVRTLERDFERTLSTTPKRWLQEQRMKMAKNLLKDRMPLRTVVRHLGFARRSQFLKEYESFFGCLPTHQVWRSPKRANGRVSGESLVQSAGG